MTSPTGPSKGTPEIPPMQPTTPTKSALDPTGTWSKFLGGAGMPASPEEVKMFIQGIMKMFNVIIQQQNAAYQRANQHLKRVIEGDE